MVNTAHGMFQAYPIIWTIFKDAGVRAFIFVKFFLFTKNIFVSSVSLPHGAVGWSVVCDCSSSWSYSNF